MLPDPLTLNSPLRVAQTRSASVGTATIFAVGIAAAGAGWCSSAIIQAADQIVRRSDNVTLRGDFTALEVSGITIRLTNGTEETVPATDVRSVRFDQEPALLAQARSNERSGALTSALEKYRQVQTDYAGSDKRLQAELQFLIARTQLRLALEDPAGREAARTAMHEFRTANKTSFRYLEATLLEAALAARIQDAAGAEALLQEVQNSSVPGYQLQAGVQLGRLRLEASDAAGALAEFERVIQQSAGDAGAAPARFDALLGKAMCLQQEKKTEDSLTVLDQILNEESGADARVLAEAWNRRGDGLRQLNQTKAALLAYLHVDVLYSSEPSEHAEALFHLSRLWAPAGHQERADDAAARLTEKYPNSSWTKQLNGG